MRRRGLLRASAAAVGGGGAMLAGLRFAGTADAQASLRVESSGGDVLARASATDTAPVSVTRESAPATQYGSVGGSGSLTIETE